MFSAPRLSHAGVLCVGLLTVTSASACAAQGYYGYQRDYYGDVERRAYDNGYAEGVGEGERDARDRRSFSYERHDDYRDADDGYRRGYGDRAFYRRFFRQGFAAGYSAGFNRVGGNRGYGYPYPPPVAAPYGYPAPAPYTRAVPYSSSAAQTGYRDGFEVGRNDARDRESYDPVRSRRYRSGDHGYDDRFGPKEAYARDYRAAFQQGYEQGYRESRRW